MAGPTKKVLFFRDFKRFTGGDLKVWDYFNHVRCSPDHSAYVWFSDTSVWDGSNPWSRCPEHVVHEPAEVDANVLFLSGVDWRCIDPVDRRDSRVPIINLIQHVKHAHPDDPLRRYRFLSHKAIRICVSSEVAKAISGTGQVRGPVFTIPDAIDLEWVRQTGRASICESKGTARRPERDVDLLIVANKQPELGAAVKARVEHRLRRNRECIPRPAARIELLDERIPRAELLGWLGRSRVSTFVPNPTEGFFLPAIEGMALGTLVVCPDVVGNRSFCVPGMNCLRPDYAEEAIAEASEVALRHPHAAAIVQRAALTAREHDLPAERKAFLEILHNVDGLWRER